MHDVAVHRDVRPRRLAARDARDERAVAGVTRDVVQAGRDRRDRRQQRAELVVDGVPVDVEGSVGDVGQPRGLRVVGAERAARCRRRRSARPRPRCRRPAAARAGQSRPGWSAEQRHQGTSGSVAGQIRPDGDPLVWARYMHVHRRDRRVIGRPGQLLVVLGVISSASSWSRPRPRPSSASIRSSASGTLREPLARFSMESTRRSGHAWLLALVGRGRSPRAPVSIPPTMPGYLRSRQQPIGLVNVAGLAVGRIGDLDANALLRERGLHGYELRIEYLFHTLTSPQSRPPGAPLSRPLWRREAARRLIHRRLHVRLTWGKLSCRAARSYGQGSRNMGGSRRDCPGRGERTAGAGAVSAERGDGARPGPARRPGRSRWTPRSPIRSSASVLREFGDIDAAVVELRTALRLARRSGWPTGRRTCSAHSGSRSSSLGAPGRPQRAERRGSRVRWPAARPGAAAPRRVPAASSTAQGRPWTT